MTYEIEVTDGNRFNEGWLRYVLGYDRPDPELDPIAADGWDTGHETTSLLGVRFVFQSQRQLERPQYVISEPPASFRCDTVHPSLGDRCTRELGHPLAHVGFVAGRIHSWVVD